MPFIYQKWIKWESETAIINALYDGDKRFGELLDLTDLSKPVLIKRLKELKNKGKIEFVPEEETRRFSYHLVKEKLDIDDEIRKKVDFLSKIVVLMLKGFAKDPETSDAEYVEILDSKIPYLFERRMINYFTAPNEVRREWLKTSLGLDYAKSVTEIYPNSRNIVPVTTPLWELIAFRHGDMKEAKKQLLEILNSDLEKVRNAYHKSFGV